MIISKYRIDKGITSIPVGTTIRDERIRARIDKIAIVIPVKSTTDRDRIINTLPDLASNNSYTINHSRKSEFYHFVLNFKAKNNPNQYIRLEYSPRRSNRGYMRLELSPQHWSAKVLSDSLKFLFSRISNTAIKWLSNSHVTRLDVALDIDGHDIMKDFVISYDKTRVGKITNHDELLGLSLGSATSAIQCVIYEKIYYNGGTVPKSVGKGTVRVNNKHIEPFTRIEVRLRPKKVQIHPSELYGIDNIFSSLRFYDINRLNNDPRIPKKLKEELINKSLPEAMKEFRGSSHKKRMKIKQIQEALDDAKVEVFSKEKIWEYWPEVLKQAGILTNQAIKSPLPNSRKLLF